MSSLRAGALAGECSRRTPAWCWRAYSMEVVNRTARTTGTSTEAWHERAGHGSERGADPKLGAGSNRVGCTGDRRHRLAPSSVPADSSWGVRLLHRLRRRGVLRLLGAALQGCPALPRFRFRASSRASLFSIAGRLARNSARSRLWLRRRAMVGYADRVRQHPAGWAIGNALGGAGGGDHRRGCLCHPPAGGSHRTRSIPLAAAQALVAAPGPGMSPRETIAPPGPPAPCPPVPLSISPAL